MKSFALFGFTILIFLDLWVSDLLPGSNGSRWCSETWVLQRYFQVSPKRVLVSWKCYAVAWHHGLNEIWWQACEWFGFALRWCSWSCMLAPGKSMQADLHAARFPHVLIIYSLPVVFVCNALFLFLLLSFHMYKSQTNLVNVCAQLISLRNKHFFGDTFDVLCFHMYKLQAYFENISVLRILLEKAIPWPHLRSAVFSYVQTPI